MEVKKPAESLTAGSGLRPANAIHTVSMLFSLDLVLIDEALLTRGLCWIWKIPEAQLASSSACAVDVSTHQVTVV
jgi:hypothetical protein